MHKFSVGQTVHFVSPTTGKNGSTGIYTVTRLLPVERSGPQYRLQSDERKEERVAQETQLALWAA